MAQLVQGLAAGVPLEQLPGHLVRQPGSAGGGVQVGVGHDPVRGGPAGGEEHRASLAARDQLGQQPGGGGLEVQRPGMAAFVAVPLILVAAIRCWRRLPAETNARRRQRRFNRWLRTGRALDPPGGTRQL